MLRPTSTVWTVIAAVALLVIGAIGACKAGLVGADFMYDLEMSRPALAEVPPVIATEGLPPRAARRVVIVIIDGLRLKSSYGLPYLDELRRAGIDSHATSHYPTFSRPNYVTIVTGVPPIESGVRTNMHGAAVALDALMDRTRAAGMASGFASDYDALPRLFLRPEAERAAAEARAGELGRDDMLDAHERKVDLSEEAARKQLDAPMVGAFDDARYSPWPGGFVDAARGLIASREELAVLLIGVVDAAGHEHGGASAEYAEAAQVADRALARALAGIDLAQDAVIVVADHGHTDRGGHGGLEPEVVEVPLIIVGAGVVPGADVHDARLADVAPTAAALLGLPAPGHGLGRTLTEALQLTDGERGAIAGNDAARLARNRQIVATAEVRASADQLENRALRGSLVIALALVAFAGMWWLRHMGGLRLDWRVLLGGVPGFFIVYYTLIGVIGQRFSPSLLPARGHLAAELAKYAVIGTIVHVVTGLRVLRQRTSLAERLAAANGVAWLGLFLAATAAGVSWVYWPPPYTEVPGPATMVLIPAIEVAVASYGIAIALGLLIEVIVFAARLSDPEARAERLEKTAAKVREKARRRTQSIPPMRVDG
ncbi:MAG: alkaline phosphatase family protein [Deltaproteobacteria bacterium]|nr:alkaline phosphatase family protein [Deltaproteobacteria bacterium]